MAGSGLKPAWDFPGLLRNVSLAAMDRLVTCMSENGSLGAARLSCRALRDAVDGSVLEMRIAVVPEHCRLHCEGMLPSLERWPRCGSFHVVVSGAAAAAVGRDLATDLLLLPFTRLTPEREARITRLSCVVQDLGLLAAQPLVNLASCLPSLRELRLQLVNLECDQEQLSLLYGALANMKQLESLSVSNCNALKGIAALGSSGSLRHLEVWDATPVLEPHTLVGLSQLQGLQRLAFKSVKPNGYFDAPVCVGFLSARLPPSLQVLELTVCKVHTESCGPSIAAILEQGKIRSVEVTPAQSLPSFLKVAAEVLVPGLPPPKQSALRPPPAPGPQQRTPPSQQPQLERLAIGGLGIKHDYELSAQHAATLSALRQRFRHVDLGTLSLGWCEHRSLHEAQLQTAWYAMQALDAVPRALHVSFFAGVRGSGSRLRRPYRSFCIQLDCGTVPPSVAGQRRSQEGTAGAGAAAAVSEANSTARTRRGRRRRRQLMSRASDASDDSTARNPSTALSVLPKAVGLLAQAAEDVAAVAAAAKPTRVGAAAGPETAETGASTGCADGGNGGGSGGGGAAMQLVLLRGPFIASLCKTSGAAESWVKLLDGLVSGAAGSCGPEPLAADSAGDGSARRDSTKHIPAYQPLPSADALLLVCEKHVTRALAAAAAEAAILEALLLPRSRLSLPGLRAGGDALEVVPLRFEWSRGAGSKALAELMQDCLLHFYEKALQAAWLQSMGADRGLPGRSLMWAALDWAFTEREQLEQELPPAVELRWQVAKH